MSGSSGGRIGGGGGSDEAPISWLHSPELEPPSNPGRFNTATRIRQGLPLVRAKSQDNNWVLFRIVFECLKPTHGHAPLFLV